MKIAQLSTFPPFRGGIAQFNSSLYHALSKKHTLQAYNFKRQYPSILFPGKTQLTQEKEITLEAQRLLDSINPFSYFSTAKEIRKFNPELLLMKYWMSFFGPSLGTVAKRQNANCKVVSILDNLIPHEPKSFDRRFNQFFVNQNHGFVVMSKKVKSDLLNFTDGKAKFVEISHPLYNHFGKSIPKENAKHSLGINNENKNLLFFGFIRKYKGLDLLLQAFEKLDNHFNLIIAGECYGNFDGYQKLIEKSRKKDKIFLFNQYIPDEQVPVLMSAADACILPYRSATQSGIESIAYHFNVPIIATDVGGLKEHVVHKKTGYIISKVDVDYLADGIVDFFDSFSLEKFEQELSILKKERSWESFGDKIIDFAKTL